MIGGLDVAPSSSTVIAKHLLLVEDDVDTRELVADSLRGAGYTVEEAGDGRDALAAIMCECPSVLITDCNMPNMSGNELVEHLALDVRLCSMPVIVVSALKQPRLPANVLVFLTKPFKIGELVAAIRRCLAASSDASEHDPNQSRLP